MRSSGEGTDERWDAALRDAFAVLLGDLPAREGRDGSGFAVYYASDTIGDELPPEEWATPEALTDPEPRRIGEYEGDFYAGAWEFDLGGSLFAIYSEFFDDEGPAASGGDFAREVRAVSIAGPDTVLVRGADLGPLLGRHGVDLADEDSGDLKFGLNVMMRVATDGSLDDAMRKATFTHLGPDHLVPFDDEDLESAEEGWEEALSAISDPALRDHLRMLCLDAHDARSDGAYYWGTKQWPVGLDSLHDGGCSLVAGWEFGEGQAGMAVVEVAGRRQ